MNGELLCRRRKPLYSFEIFADSSANIPDEFVERYRIGIVPYPYIVNGQEHSAYVE